MGLEKTVLNELDEQVDVQDVYFSKSVLHVLNAYDIDRVRGYMEINYPSIKIALDEESYDPFVTVNS